MWKQRIIQAVWILAGAGTIVLLLAAMQKKSGKLIKGQPDVEIIGVASEQVFIGESTIKDMLKHKGGLTGVAVNMIDLRSIEETLEKDPWIKNAELFFDNGQVLQVKITQREPVARVFTVTGNSFYLDSSGRILPLSEKLTARVPVFTGFPLGKKLSKPDSVLLKDVITLSNYIYADSFWNAQIAQVDITGNEFDMVPVIGDHIIQFGDINHMESKFKKLFSFYRNISTRVGFNKYETINLKYEGQIVATRRGAVVPVSDSAAAIQQLQSSLESVQSLARDTVQRRSPVTRARNDQQQRQPRAVMRREK